VNAILAPDHRGMRLDAVHYLRNGGEPALTFVRQEMARHLEELGRRYYAGDVAAVDEFLQLYCIAESERAAVVAERAKQNEAQP